MNRSLREPDSFLRFIREEHKKPSPIVRFNLLLKLSGLKECSEDEEEEKK